MFKDTKEKKFFRIFKASKYLENAYQSDKDNIITKYNEKGLRDAKIIRDTVFYDEEENLINISLDIKEGKPYYFGNINFVGNTKYSNQELSEIVSIEKGIFSTKVSSKHECLAVQIVTIYTLSI